MRYYCLWPFLILGGPFPHACNYGQHELEKSSSTLKILWPRFALQVAKPALRPIRCLDAYFFPLCTKITQCLKKVSFLKTWSLRSNIVTRQVNFNRTKIGGKCQNLTIQCDILGDFQTLWIEFFAKFLSKICWDTW